MLNVEFEGDNSTNRINSYSGIPTKEKVPISKKRLYVYIAIILISLVATIIVSYYTYGGSKPKPVPYSELSPSEKRAIPKKERTYLEKQIILKNK